MKKDKLVVDVSYHQILSPEQWDLLATVLDGVIIRLSFDLNTDTSAQKHIDQCNRVGLPYSGYHWVDPTVDMTKQLTKVVEVIRKFKPFSMFNDYEQYWTDWAAYERQDLAECYRTRFTPEQLTTYYSTFNTKIRRMVTTMPVGNYSASWFMDSFCPGIKDWVIKNYWEALYLRYHDIEYWEEKKKEFPFDIMRMREIADEVVIYNGLGRQFETYVEINGFSKWRGWHLDWNIFNENGFSLMFGGEMGKILNMAFVSQLGVGAGDHHNDCGLACCSMLLLAAKDIFVQVDEWYKMDGWGAPAFDTGTTSYQLQKALNLFDVRTAIGSVLTLAKMRDYINKALPFIPLVDYKVLSDAGVTRYKGNFLHWVVVMGYDENNIIALDPYVPYDIGGKMIIPNQVFLNSYRSSYLALVDSIEGGTMPITYNGKVTTASLNVRETPPENGVMGNKIGGLVLNNSVYIERSTITVDNWGNVTASNNSTNPIGWVSMDYIKLDPASPLPPTDIAVKTAQLKELSLMEDYINKRKVEIGS